MKRNQFWLWLATIIAAVSLALSDRQIGSGFLIFYPPELVIYLFLAVLLLMPGGWRRLRSAITAWPAGLRYAVLVILITGLVATFVSPLFPHSLGAFKSWIITPLAAALLVSSFSEDYRHWFYNIAILFGLIVAIGVLIGFSPAHPALRLQGWYVSPNVTAELLGPISAIVYVFWRQRQLYRGIGTLALVIFLVALLLTQSVGGLLALGVTALGYELTRRVGRGNLKYLLVAGVLAVIAFFILSSRLAESNNSLDSRIQIWHTAWRIIEVWPITGVGLRGFEYYYPKVLPQIAATPLDWSAPHPHNLILSWWVTLGIFGLIAMLYLLYLAWKRQRLTDPAWWALLAIFLHGLVDTPYWRTDLTILFWIYLMLVLLPHDGVAKAQ